MYNYFMNSFKNNIANGCEYLSLNDPVLSKLIEKYGPPTYKPHNNYYEELVSSIISQQLSVKAASTIWNRFLNIFSGLMPTPEQIIQTKDDDIRAAGVSYSKVGYIKDLAEHIVNRKLDLNNISKLPNDKIITQLTEVKGIGEWSAHMFLIFSLGRLDVLPWGDLGIRNGIMLNYELNELPNKKEMVDISIKNKWNPYESIAAWYLWKSLDNKN